MSRTLTKAALAALYLTSNLPALEDSPGEAARMFFAALLFGAIWSSIDA